MNRILLIVPTNFSMSILEEEIKIAKEQRLRTNRRLIIYSNCRAYNKHLFALQLSETLQKDFSLYATVNVSF